MKKWSFRTLRWVVIIWAGFTIPDIYDIGTEAPYEWYMFNGYPKVTLPTEVTDSSKSKKYEIEFKLYDQTTIRKMYRNWEPISDKDLEAYVREPWQRIVDQCPNNIGAAMRNQLGGAFFQTISRFFGTVAGFLGVVAASEHWATRSNVEQFPVGPMHADYTCLKACLILGRIAGWWCILYIFILPYRFLKIFVEPSAVAIPAKSTEFTPVPISQIPDTHANEIK